MLMKIDNGRAFGMLINSNKKERDKVFFKGDRDTYQKALEVVWYFGERSIMNRGVHFASTTFYEERDDNDGV